MSRIIYVFYLLNITLYHLNCLITYITCWFICSQLLCIYFECWIYKNNYQHPYCHPQKSYFTKTASLEKNISTLSFIPQRIISWRKKRQQNQSNKNNTTLRLTLSTSLEEARELVDVVKESRDVVEATAERLKLPKDVLLTEAERTLPRHGFELFLSVWVEGEGKWESLVRSSCSNNGVER